MGLIGLLGSYHNEGTLTGGTFNSAYVVPKHSSIIAILNVKSPDTFTFGSFTDEVGNTYVADTSVISATGLIYGYCQDTQQDIAVGDSCTCAFATGSTDELMFTMLAFDQKIKTPIFKSDVTTVGSKTFDIRVTPNAIGNTEIFINGPFGVVVTGSGVKSGDGAQILDIRTTKRALSVGYTDPVTSVAPLDQIITWSNSHTGFTATLDLAPDITLTPTTLTGVPKGDIVDGIGSNLAATSVIYIDPPSLIAEITPAQPLVYGNALPGKPLVFSSVPNGGVVDGQPGVTTEQGIWVASNTTTEQWTRIR